jgi:large subunit ribosomal protein L9
MKVILHKDVTKVGREGEVVTVADGYARNYLLPRQLAVPATGGELKNVERRRALEEKKAVELKDEADKAAAALEGKTVKVEARAGTGERLYGSITSGDIADAIQKGLGINVDRRKVQLTDPIKAMGTFTVPIKLHRDITVPVTVEVVKAAA